MKASYTIYIILLALTLLTGCSGGIFGSYRPIEELQTVETLGLDAAPGGLRLCCAVAKRGDTPGFTVSGSASGIAQGLDGLRAEAETGRLFFAHTRFLLAGQSFAEDGVGSLLDFVERDVRTRMGTKLLLLRDGSAEAAVTGAGEEGITAALDALEQELLRRGIPVPDVRQIAVALSEYGAAPVFALTLTEDFQISPCGYGIVGESGFVGWLDESRSEMLGLLTGQTGTLLRQIPLEGGFVTAELSGGTCGIRYLPDAGALEVSAALNAAVTELKDISGPEALTETVEARLAAALEAELTDLLAELAAMNADAAGFGRALRRAGTEPARLPDNWLQTLDYRVSAAVTLAHSYDMGEPARAEGGAA